MAKIVDKYRLNSVLGSGQFGKVYKAVNMKTNEEFAVKAIKRNIFEENPKLKQFVVNEIQTLSRINNENVVKFIEMITTYNNIYFVYEFCNGGTLEDAIFSRGYYLESEAMVIFNQIVNGLCSVVQLNIMHRDLKPQNILFHNGVAKIADFGFCKPMTTRKDMAKTILGSPIYMAPEILLGEEYTMKADIWSLGVMLYEMLFGKCPFEGKNIAQLIDLIKEYEIKFPPEFKVSESATRLICRMLTRDANKRIEWEGISEALQNPGLLIKKPPLAINPTINMNFTKEQKDLAVSEPGLPKLKLDTTSKLEPNSPSLPLNTALPHVHYYTPTHHNESIARGLAVSRDATPCMGNNSGFAVSRDATPSMSNNVFFNKPNKFDSFEGSSTPSMNSMQVSIGSPLQTPTNFGEEKTRSKSNFSTTYAQSSYSKTMTHPENPFRITLNAAINDKDGFLLFLNKEIMKIYYLTQVFSNLHVYKLCQEFSTFELLFLKFLYLHTKKIKDSLLDKIDFEISSKISNVLEFIKLPEYNAFEKEILGQLEKISSLFFHQKKVFFQGNPLVDDIELENDNVFNFKKFLLTMFEYIEAIKKDFLYSNDEKYKAADSSKYIIFLNELIDSILIEELFNKFIHEKSNLNGQKYFEDIKQSPINSILMIVSQKIEFAKSKYKLKD